MVLVLIAAALLAYGFVAQRSQLSSAAKRRLVMIGVPTVLLVVLLSWQRLSPIGLVVMLLGIGLASNVVMRERAQQTFEDLAEGAPPPRRPAGGMAREEALAVLGLEGEPGDDEIQAAHKRMIVRAHPDQGGSDYLAAKVNEARRVLLPKD